MTHRIQDTPRATPGLYVIKNDVVAVVDKRILLGAENALLPLGEYNIGKVADAPMTGRTPSDEARKRMSESAKRRCQRERAEREALK